MIIHKLETVHVRLINRHDQINHIASSTGHGLSAGAIGGIVGGILGVALLICVVVIFYLLNHRKGRVVVSTTNVSSARGDYGNSRHEKGYTESSVNKGYTEEPASAALSSDNQQIAGAPSQDVEIGGRLRYPDEPVDGVDRVI